MRRPSFDVSWPPSVRALFEHDIQEIWEPQLAPHVARMYRNQLRRYMGFVPTRKALDILDVGCAQGTLALLLAEQGHRVVAMDLRKEFLEYAKLRYESGDIEFICSDFRQAALAKRFDLIFANQILEHLVQPIELIKQAVKHLRPGGRLIASTPNCLYVTNRLPSMGALRNPDAFSSLDGSADGDAHFFFFEPDELRDLFISAGATAVSVEFFETPWISGNMKFRLVTNHLPFRMLRAMEAITTTLPLVRSRLAQQLLAIGVAP